MAESIMQQYMAQKGLNQNQVAQAAGLARNSIQRQVEADFEGITMRTVLLLANVEQRDPREVFADLYGLIGSTNTWSDAAGIYRELGQDDTFGLQEALRRLYASRTANKAITIDGGDEPNAISITSKGDRFMWTFAADSDPNFTKMWRQLMAQGFPTATEE